MVQAVMMLLVCPQTPEACLCPLCPPGTFIISPEGQRLCFWKPPLSWSRFSWGGTSLSLSLPTPVPPSRSSLAAISLHTFCTLLTSCWGLGPGGAADITSEKVCVKKQTNKRINKQNHEENDLSRKRERESMGPLVSVLPGVSPFSERSLGRLGSRSGARLLPSAVVCYLPPLLAGSFSRWGTTGKKLTVNPLFIWPTCLHRNNIGC